MTADEYVVSELQETKRSLSAVRDDLKLAKAQNKLLEEVVTDRENDIRFLISLIEKRETTAGNSYLYEFKEIIFQDLDNDKYNVLESIMNDYKEETTDGNE